VKGDRGKGLVVNIKQNVYVVTGGADLADIGVN
jgi:hypothetical protein